MSDWVADEVPVALQYNGISHAVMLATPLDLEDFAYGFALSEGIADDAGDVRDVDVEHEEAGIVLQVEVASRCMARLKERRRTLAGRTGCGLCGTESLAQALPPSTAASHRSCDRTPPRCLARCRKAGAGPTGRDRRDTRCRLVRRRRLAAVAARRRGRHNALDKLIGALARESNRCAAGFFAVTSRASYEMVQKTVRAGVGALAAISAPPPWRCAVRRRPACA